MASKRALKRRLSALIEKEADERREVAAMAVEMYREGRLDTDALSQRADELNRISDEIAPFDPAGTKVEPPVADSSPVSNDTAEFEAPGPTETAEFDAPVASETAEFDAAAPDETAVFEVVEEPASTALPTSSSLDQLLSEIENAERDLNNRALSATDSAATADTSDSVALASLEAELAREQQVADQALAEMQSKVDEAEKRAAEAAADTAEAKARVAVAEQASRETEAKLRTAAAEWIRRQVEEIKAQAAGPGPTAALESAAAERAEMELALRAAEVARAQAEAGRGAAESVLAKADTDHKAAIAKLEADLGRVREEKAQAVQAAERRLAEIEEHALAATSRIDEAEQKFSDEQNQALADAEARADAAEADARQAAAQWLRGQIAALRAEIERGNAAQSPSSESGSDPADSPRDGV